MLQQSIQQYLLLSQNKHDRVSIAPAVKLNVCDISCTLRDTTKAQTDLLLSPTTHDENSFSFATNCLSYNLLHFYAQCSAHT